MTGRIAKRILFSLIALVLALVLLEGLARLGERLHPQPPVDARSLLPYQQLPDNPLVVQIQVHDHDYQRLFWPQWHWEIFPQEKPDDEVRIVLIGGSAAVGHGVAEPVCFASILERLLNRHSDGSRYRVLNLARTGYASPQHAYLFDQVADIIKPDLVMTVMGNNEYLDVAAAYVAHGKAMPLFTRARWLEHRSALARWLRPKLRPPMSNELKHWVTSYNRSDEVRQYVQQRLHNSLIDIAAAARRNGAPLLFCTVPVNMRNLAGREWFWAGIQNHPQDFVQARYELTYGLPSEATRLMQARLALDENDVAAHMVLAMAAEAAKDKNREEQHYRRVLELLETPPPGMVLENQRFMKAVAVRALEGPEACRQISAPWIEHFKKNQEVNSGIVAALYSLCDDQKQAREWFDRFLLNRFNVADGDINRTLMQTAEQLPDASVYDLSETMAQMSPQGILGYEYFLEYCHFNVRGHVLIAHLLAPVVAKQFGMSASFPDPLDAVVEDDGLRHGRLADLPVLERWAGVDFDVSRLTDEVIPDPDIAADPLRQYIARHGESALALTFSGNREAVGPNGGPNSTTALDAYQRALELDPDFSPAQVNIELIRQMD